MSREIISTPHAPGAIGPYSQAVSVSTGRMVFTSGQIPLHPETGEMVGGDDVKAQAAQVMKNLEAVLEAAGVTFAHVVRSTIYLADLEDFAAVNEVYAARFPAAPRLGPACRSPDCPGMHGSRSTAWPSPGTSDGEDGAWGRRARTTLACADWA